MSVSSSSTSINDPVVMTKLRSILSLDKEPWLELSSDLLATCFIFSAHKSVDRSSVYGFKDLQLSEFLGDSVLEMIIRKYVLSNNTGKERERIRIELTSNMTLGCNSKLKDICKYLRLDGKPDVKMCADIIESLIGILYFHQRNIMKKIDAFELVEAWYIENFLVEEQYNILLSNESIYGKCDLKSKDCPCESGK